MIKRRTLIARRRLTSERVEPPALDTKIQEKNLETSWKDSSVWSHAQREKELITSSGKSDNCMTEKKMVCTQNQCELPEPVTAKCPPNETSKSLTKIHCAVTRLSERPDITGKDSSSSATAPYTEANMKRNASLLISVENHKKKVFNPLVNSLSKDVHVNSSAFHGEGMNGPSHSQAPLSSVTGSTVGNLPLPSTKVGLQNTSLSAKEKTILPSTHRCSHTVHVNSISGDLLKIPAQDSTSSSQSASLMARTQDTNMQVGGRRVNCFFSSSGTVKSLSLIGKFNSLGSLSVKQGITGSVRPRLMNSLMPIKMHRITSCTHTSKIWQTLERVCPRHLKNMKAEKVKQYTGSTRKCAERIKTGASSIVQTKNAYPHKLKVNPEMMTNIKENVAKLLRHKCLKITAEPESNSYSRCLWDLYPSVNITPQRCKRTSSATVCQFHKKKAMDPHSLDGGSIPWVGQSDRSSSIEKAKSSERKSLPAKTLSDENYLHLGLFSEKRKVACQGIEEQSNLCPESSQGNFTNFESHVIQRGPKEQLFIPVSSSLPLPCSMDSDSVHTLTKNIREIGTYPDSGLFWLREEKPDSCSAMKDSTVVTAARSMEETLSTDTGSTHILTEDIQEMQTKPDVCSLLQRKDKLETCSAMKDKTVVTPSRSLAEKRCCHTLAVSPNQLRSIVLPVERPDLGPDQSPEVLHRTASGDELDVTISPPKLNAAVKKLSVSHDVEKSINSPHFTTPTPPFLSPVPLVPQHPNCSKLSQLTSVSKETAFHVSAYQDESLNILTRVCDLERARIETERALFLKPELPTATSVTTFTASQFRILNLLPQSPSSSSNTNYKGTLDKVESEEGRHKIVDKRAVKYGINCTHNNGNEDVVQHNKDMNLNQEAAVNLQKAGSSSIRKINCKATTKSRKLNSQYNRLMAEAKYFLELQDRKSRGMRNRNFEHVKGKVNQNVVETESFKKSTRGRHNKEHDKMPFHYVSFDKRKGKFKDEISFNCEASVKVTRIDMGGARSVILEERQCCNVTDSGIDSTDQSKNEAMLLKREEDKATVFSPQKSRTPEDVSSIGEGTSSSKDASLATIMQSPEFKQCKPLRIPLSRIQFDRLDEKREQKGDKRNGFEVSQENIWNSAKGLETVSLDTVHVSGRRRLNFEQTVEGEIYTITGKSKGLKACYAERLKAKDQNSPIKGNDASLISKVDYAEHTILNTESNACEVCVDHSQDINDNTDNTLETIPAKPLFSEQALHKDSHKPNIQKDFTALKKKVQGKNFIKAGSSVFSVRMISKPLLSCKFCNGYSARWQQEVNSHVREAHPFRCYKCFKTFDSKEERLTHGREHITALHHCSVCNRAFTKYYFYIKHVKGQAHRQCLQVQQNTFKRIRAALRKQMKVLEDSQRCKDLLAVEDQAFNETETLDRKVNPKQDSAIEHFYHGTSFQRQMAKFEEKELSKIITLAVAQMCSSGTQLGLHKDLETEGDGCHRAPILALPAPSTSCAISQSAPSRSTERVYSVSETVPSGYTETSYAIPQLEPSRQLMRSCASSKTASSSFCEAPCTISQADHCYSSSSFTLSQDDDAFLTSLLDVGDVKKDPSKSTENVNDGLLPHFGWITQSVDVIQGEDNFISELDSESPSWTLPVASKPMVKPEDSSTASNKSRQDIDLTSLLRDLPNDDATNSVPEGTIVDSESLKTADLSFGENLLLLL